MKSERSFLRFVFYMGLFSDFKGRLDNYDLRTFC